MVSCRNETNLPITSIKPYFIGKTIGLSTPVNIRKPWIHIGGTDCEESHVHR